jgi:soluble lytic murein transglycosylase
MRNKTIIILWVLILSLLSGCVQMPTISKTGTTVIASDTPSPSPSPTLAPTPTPTFTPLELIDQGDYALFVGDYETAYEIFQQTRQQNSDPQIVAKSHLGSGQALLAQDIYGNALDFFRKAASSEDPIIAARAYYLLGKTYTELERYEEALDAYETYLTLRPGVIDTHVMMLQGDIQLTIGNFESAIESYERAYQNDPYGGSENLAVKIAETYEAAGNLDTALILYQEILSLSGNDYTKARLDLLIGRIYLSRGETDQAYAFFQDAVENYPYTYDAYSALVTLVNNNIPVNEYKRGLVNYYVENYALAIEAFDRYNNQDDKTYIDAALYYKALATRANGLNNNGEGYEESVLLWKQLIENYPTSEFFIDAWEDIEFTLWAYLNDPQRAAETALEYVAQRPDSESSPDFLFLAGRSYERANLLAEAADTWVRIADEYPNSDQTFRAIYFAGITQVREGNWSVAQSLFARALVLSSQPAEIAAAHLWIGKCQQALGDMSAAVDSWKLAQTSDPFGHYSIRAEDLLIGREVFAEPETYELNPDLSPYILEAETWLRTTFELPADTNLESPGLLANDSRFQRGIEFWALGNYAAGKNEFELLRIEYQDDPAQTFRLIPALVNIGLYRSALVASTNLLKSAGLEGADALSAPEYFSRVRFGAYYLDWAIPIAEDNNIHPLLLLAIIRQESTYEGFISSGAGAIGLMQIIPSTGKQLANELQWPENYTIDDLNRPYVSLVFGATYLRKQRNFFNGDLFAMLAAYNGGPGNTIAWKELANTQDPDLFLEIIRIQETRNYIRLINEIHYIYRWLYGSTMDW